MTPTILPIPNYIDIISTALDYKKFQVEIVLELTAEGATVPFIARYRKERTGNLDENNIRDIISSIPRRRISTRRSKLPSMGSKSSER